MNKVKFLAIGAVMVAAAVPAYAQVAEPVGLSVRVGTFLPSEQAARNISRAWFAAGAQYVVSDTTPFSRPGYRTEFAVSLDYTARNNYRQLPLLVNYIGHLSDRLSYSAGVGFAFTQTPAAGGTMDKTRFAYAIGAAYDLQTTGRFPLFIEGRFMGNEKSELNGIGLFLGIRL
jgi:hypothetical protein